MDSRVSLDPVALRIALDGDHRLVREQVRATIARPEFEKPAAALPVEGYREKVAEWTRALAATGGPSLLFPVEFGGVGRVGDAIAAFETLAHSDLSLLVKCGVQFGLFGGAVHHLGTRSHPGASLPRVGPLERAGGFAGRGAGPWPNAQQAETPAGGDGAT